MSALGFGQKVTGGGTTPNTINVTNGDKSGNGSLAKAISDALTIPTGKTGTHIVIAANVTVGAADEQITVRARDLTISGAAGSKIRSNLLYFDCTQSDNVKLENLTFEGASTDKKKLRDAIKFDADTGRGPTGFWIDHCHFEAYFDLNITSNAHDPAAGTTLDPLLLTISNCYFHNDHPNGNDHEDNGAIGIHGSTVAGQRNTQTNAYATVCNNYFDHVRRRSPRSSGLCIVHAFNNVLEEWGTSDSDAEQANGMQSGHDGRLVAEANYFKAGPMTETINVSTKAGLLGQLTIDDDDRPGNTVKNIYKAGAVATPQTTAHPDIAQAYADVNLTAPPVQAMTQALRGQIKDTAGTA
jgi:pectate lyase